MWDGVIVRFHEVALKGKNRLVYAKMLQKNIERALGLKVVRSWDGFFIKTMETESVAFRAVQVVGVAHAAPVCVVEKSVDAMVQAGVELYGASGGGSFVVRVTRSDKSFPLTSLELEREVGGRIGEVIGARVDLKNAEVVLRFLVVREGVYLVGQKVDGVGGLPLGSSGNVATLLSGGFDSPVAAWLMMRRGCPTDFIHFHALRSSKEVEESKIPVLAKKILEAQGVSARLFIVSSEVFQLALLGSGVQQGLELILFRRFMMCVSNVLAEKFGFVALVSGDNLGQVASQTMESLVAVDDVVGVPLFRPLLAFNKPEIIALAKKLGTHDLSVQEYKDCCSIVARHPKTRPSLDDVIDAEKLLNIEEMVKKTVEQVSVITLKS